MNPCASTRCDGEAQFIMIVDPRDLIELTLGRISHTGTHANDSWAGPTFNAAGREFAPGGSSAGTAAAVAANMAVLGLAEETGGSMQNPGAAADVKHSNTL